MFDVALVIPLRRFALVGFAQGDDAVMPRVQKFGNGLDRAALAGGIAAFQQDQHALSGADEPALKLDQFDVELL